MRKTLQTVAALLAALTLAFTLSGSANATVSGFGQTNSFVHWPANAGCWDNASAYSYEAYRATANTIQIRWSTHENGNMKVTIDAAGNENHTYRASGDQNLGSPVYWLNWTAKLNYRFWLTWMPDGGGSCNVYFPIPTP